MILGTLEVQVGVDGAQRVPAVVPVWHYHPNTIPYMASFWARNHATFGCDHFKAEASGHERVHVLHFLRPWLQRPQPGYSKYGCCNPSPQVWNPSPQAWSKVALFGVLGGSPNPRSRKICTGAWEAQQWQAPERVQSDRGHARTPARPDLERQRT